MSHVLHIVRQEDHRQRHDGVMMGVSAVGNRRIHYPVTTEPTAKPAEAARCADRPTHGHVRRRMTRYDPRPATSRRPAVLVSVGHRDA